MVHYRWYELVHRAGGMNWVRGGWCELIHTITCPVLAFWYSQIDYILRQFIIANLVQIELVGIRCSPPNWAESLLRFYQSDLFKSMKKLPCRLL